MKEEWAMIRSEYTCIHGAPWNVNDLPNPRMSKIYKLLLRDRVKSLSKKKEIWASRWTELLKPPPEDFELSIASIKFQAKCALDLDPNLERARLDLVPGKISEAAFWRAYFWHIELIKLDLMNFLSSGVPLEELEKMVRNMPPLDHVPADAYFIPIPLPPISQVAILRHHVNSKLQSLVSVSAEDRAKAVQRQQHQVASQDDSGAAKRRVQFMLDL